MGRGEPECVGMGGDVDRTRRPDPKSSATRRVAAVSISPAATSGRIATRTIRPASSDTDPRPALVDLDPVRPRISGTRPKPIPLKPDVPATRLVKNYRQDIAGGALAGQERRPFGCSVRPVHEDRVRSSHHCRSILTNLAAGTCGLRGIGLGRLCPEIQARTESSPLSAGSGSVSQDAGRR